MSLSSQSSPTNISDLPDLCLLLVFDHLPLLDLFNRIPLVCPRWTALQHSALARRTILHLLPNEFDGETYPLSKIFSFYRRISKQEWSLTDHSREDEERVALDTLPLPHLYHGWTSGTGGRFLQRQAVEWLRHKLPNIIELTVVLDSREFDVYVKFDDPTDHDHRYNRLKNMLQEQAICVITTGWCSRLTTLRVHLATWEFSYSPADDPLGDDLIEAINHRMPNLSQLYIGSLPSKTSVLLSGDTLARLRLLHFDANYDSYRIRDKIDSSSRWESLCSAKAKLRPDLSIILPYIRIVSEVLKRPQMSAVFDHIRAIELLPDLDSQELTLMLHLIPERFHALHSLTLCPYGTLDADPSDVLITALRHLQPLVSLVSLKLRNFNLLPFVDGKRSQPNFEDMDVVMPSLQRLSFETHQLWSHTELGKALRWSHTLPRLRDLTLSAPYVYNSCVDCHPNLEPDPDDEPGAQIYRGYADSFFAESECRRLAIEPLQVCAELAKVELDEQISTRTDSSVPFQWEENTP